MENSLDASPARRREPGFALDDDASDGNPEPTLDDLPPRERGGKTPAEIAKELLRLRNPILPHPRTRPGAR